MEAIERAIAFDENGNVLLIFGRHFFGGKAKVIVMVEDQETDEHS